MFGCVSFGRGSFSRMSFGCMVIWMRGHVVARSYGRRVIWSEDHLVTRSFGRECLVAGHLVACHLVVGSFSRVVIRSHGYLVAGHLVAGHLVAGHLVAGHLFAGHLVALIEKSILTYLQK
jgi:hypothetical protein